MGLRPCIHGARDTFAVTTLADWYREGADVQAPLPLLSAWHGHANPRHTYWYLSAAPEVLALAAARPGNGVMTALGPTLQAFFTGRLTRQKNASRMN